MEASALRVRDRFLIHQAVQQLYTEHDLRMAAWAPPREFIAAVAEGLWEPRQEFSVREAGLGILRGVKRLLGLLKRAGKRGWAALSKALGLEELEGAKDLATKGKAALGKVFKKVKSTFPLSLYFMPKGKAPGLTDLMKRIAMKSPKVWAVVQRIRGGAEVIDKWMKKYLPGVSRVLLGAIFIFCWFNVAEISWDLEGLLAGFTGDITLPDLLASLPESAIGLLAATFGLGYGALPITIIIRIAWLVANHYLEWIPGKGLRVKWSEMEVAESDEVIAT